MEEKNLRPSEEALMEREEKCRKTIRAIARALLMRLFAAALLLLALVRTTQEVWVLGLMAFVLIITLSGALPLITELKKQRTLLREIMDQYP